MSNSIVNQSSKSMETEFLTVSAKYSTKFSDSELC